MIEKYYNIHNIVKFKIVDKNNFFNRLFSDVFVQYKNFESEEIDKPDITIYLGNFTSSNQDCCILDDKYYVREDYLYCKGDSYKLAKWEFEISGFESGNMIACISNNSIGSMFISGNIIDFLIHYKMNEKGYPMVHASCVSKNTHAQLFSARSGGGKTTIALNLLDNGFDFLGDNFITLHENNVLSFLSPLNIFTYNLTPIIKGNFGVKSRIVLSFKNLLYKVTMGYVKIFTKINVKDIFMEKIIDKSQLEAMFIIIPKEKFQIGRIGKDELIEHLVMNQKLDSPYFLKYILEYSYMFPESKLANHWNRYKDILGRNLSDDILFYKVEVPQRYDREVFGKILEVIENGI